MGGMPEFEYTGNYTLVDDGSESGFWTYAFTSSGILTLMKKIAKAAIKIQGAGGGSGASNGSTNGSDGQDGEIQSLSDIKLPKDEYSIVIGAAGARGYSSAGYKGGDTSFDDLLTAVGGTGGPLGGNAYNKTHTSIYEEYGKGAIGGTIYQYSGSATYKYVFTASSLAYMYNQPSSINGQNMGSVAAGGTVYLASNTVYSSTDGSSDRWYKTESGYYISVAKGSVSYKAISDTRRWYGVAGNSGIVLLSGKA